MSTAKHLSRCLGKLEYLEDTQLDEPMSNPL